MHAFGQTGFYSKKEVYLYDSLVKKFQLESSTAVKLKIDINVEKQVISFDGNVFATIESDKDSTSGYPDWYCTDFENKKCYVQLIPQKNGGSIVAVLYFDGYLIEYYSDVRL